MKTKNKKNNILLSEVFSQLSKLLRYLNSNILKFEATLQENPLNYNKIQDAIASITEGIYYSGLIDETAQLKLFTKRIILDIEKLKEVLNHEEHHKGILEWVGYTKLSENEQIIEQEKYFVKLLG